ncbi:MAG: hypothetical protein LRZ94_00605 [Candidatus Pacebacteria bacterium]|nr:hypothetical protein [Candidatus Paceibacterota bacterium]
MNFQINRTIRIALLLILIFFLFIGKTSFFVGFNFFNYLFFFCLFLIFLFLFVEAPEKFTGIILVVFSGFLLDVFSSGTIGPYIIMMTIAGFILKFLAKNYVRIPTTI